MKILFLSHYFPPEVNAPASRTYEHGARWVEAGHDVTVVTCVPNCPDGVAFAGYRNQLRRQIEEVDGIRVVRVWTYLAANAGTARRIVNYLSYLLMASWAVIRLPKPDVIVATSPQFFCGWAGVISSWLRRCPFVLEIRDIWPESIEAVGAMRSRWLLRFLEYLERRMYRAADQIVTVGNGYAERIALKCAAGDKISVIMNGVDCAQFTPCEDGRFRDERGWQGKFVCSYVGTIGLAHGLDVVLDAAVLLREAGRNDVHFCLVGDGARRRALQEKAAVLDVQDFVTFTGRLPREIVPDVLACSDACLIHLKGCELFGSVIPSKIFETMAMRRPIVMGVKGEARDLVMDAEAGIEMVPDSAESLYEAVTRLADDPELGRRLGSSGRDYVKERFNRDQLAARYLELLMDVVQRGDSTESGAQRREDAKKEARSVRI